MNAVTIHDAKTNLSKYIAAAKRGERVYIGSFGKAEVVLSMVPVGSKVKSKKRQFGTIKAKIWAAPDAFSEKVDKEIADAMLNGDIEP